MVDFTKSLKDGLAFVALIHRKVPKMIDWAKLSAATPAERWATGFVAVEKLGCPHMVSWGQYSLGVCCFRANVRIIMSVLIALLVRASTLLFVINSWF